VEGCGAELRATAARYLDRVEVDADTRQIVAYKTWHGNDPDGFAWDHEATRVYCDGEDEHELTDWRSPHAGPDGWALIGGYGDVPSPIEAEATNHSPECRGKGAGGSAHDLQRCAACRASNAAALTGPQ
jgi:hypothetical protein